MSRLSRLMGEAKDFVIGGETFTLRPLPMKYIDTIMNLDNQDKRGAAMIELVNATLKLSVPDATEEELEKVGLRYFKELSEAIMDVNGLKDDKPQEKVPKS